MNVSAETIPAKSKNAVYRIVDGEAVIVEPKKGLVNVANDVGSRIWDLIDGKNSVAKIAEIITAEYDISPDQALRDTLEFLRELENNELITVSA